MSDEEQIYKSVSGLKIMSSDIEEMFQSTKTSILSLENFMDLLEKLNEDHLNFCGEKLALLSSSEPHKSHHWLTDNDGLIHGRSMEIQMKNNELHESQSKAMALLDEISCNCATLYSKLDAIDEYIKFHGIDIPGISQDLTVVEDSSAQFFQSLAPLKESLKILQTKFTNLQEDISSWKDALRDPVILTIKHECLKTLWAYLHGPIDLSSSAKPFRDVVDEVLQNFEIYQLTNIMANKPLSDIVVIECWKRIRFAIWRINKGDMPIQGNKWESYFGDVLDQLDHEICWAIVAAELVSVIRSIMGYDRPRIDYSAQYLVDFTNPTLRCEMRCAHFCYSCHVKVALDHVRENGIESAEARPLNPSCVQDVRPRNSSNLGYIGGVISLETLEEALPVLEVHPLAASIPIFEPEYMHIKNKIYRGPTSRISRYKSMHAVNITGGGEENGEKFLWTRSSHGTDLGVKGYLKVSVDMMCCCLTTGKHEDFIEHPFPLISEYVYPSLLLKFEDEKKREEEKRARRREELRKAV